MFVVARQVGKNRMVYLSHLRNGKADTHWNRAGAKRFHDRSEAWEAAHAAPKDPKDNPWFVMEEPEQQERA